MWSLPKVATPWGGGGGDTQEKISHSCELVLCGWLPLSERSSKSQMMDEVGGGWGEPRCLEGDRSEGPRADLAPSRPKWEGLKSSQTPNRNDRYTNVVCRGA